jgi:branched-chain amino acid aminotransferase
MHHIWHNGQYFPVNDFKTSIYDLGLLRAYGLFDYFRTYGGKPFQWDWYWERYENSAKKLGIANIIKKAEAKAVVDQLIELQGGADCAIRFLLTGGYTLDSVSAQQPNLFICSEDLHLTSPNEYEQGIKLISYAYLRDMYDIKSTDYKHFMVLMPQIKSEGASDVLFHHNGLVSEMSRSNVFIVKNGILITPNDGILRGITRRTVMALVKDIYAVEERPVSLEEFLNADEAFTTSTTKGVLAIRQVDEHLIGNGKVGEHTLKIAELFWEFTKKINA